MKFNKDMLLLYAITDQRWAAETPLYRQVEAALRGGATMIQLREKDLAEERFIEEALMIGDLCHRYNVPLIIDDNVHVALKSGADGVHVGAEDMSVEDVRRMTGRDFIIGATAKTPSQAIAAEKSGADYLGVGAVFPSPTKSSAVRITTQQLNEICSSVAIPAVAIGGINENNIQELYGCGAAGIAVISAIFGSRDIASATAALRSKAKEVLFP